MTNYKIIIEELEKAKNFCIKNKIHNLDIFIGYLMAGLFLNFTDEQKEKKLWKLFCQYEMEVIKE